MHGGPLKFEVVDDGLDTGGGAGIVGIAPRRTRHGNRPQDTAATLDGPSPQPRSRADAGERRSSGNRATGFWPGSVVACRKLAAVHALPVAISGNVRQQMVAKDLHDPDLSTTANGDLISSLAA